MTIKKENEQGFVTIPLIVFAVVAVAVVGGGIFYFAGQKGEIQEGLEPDILKETPLSAEKDLKETGGEGKIVTPLLPGKNPEKCPDGIWDEAEQKDPTLCPEDKPKLNDPQVQQPTERKILEQQPPQEFKDFDYKRHNLDIVYQFNPVPRPSWVPVSGGIGPGGKIANHPYDGSIYMAISKDGVIFSGKKLFIHHAGVPHITITKDEKLIATFQYFSPTDQTIFDVIAYTTSDDFGLTWSPVNRFYVRDVCPAERNKCNDPVLSQTQDGKFRLYFSHSGPQEPGFWMYSAINERLDVPFVNEGPQVNASDVSDPAVVFFKNKWHYYANKGDAETSGKFVGVHAVSDTGQKFTRINDSIILDLPFLGDVIEDNGKLRFFAGHNSAYSVDGDNWIMEDGARIDKGADPGIVKLPDGSYIMLYVDGGPTDQ